MFNNAKNFNQDISSWNVSKVIASYDFCKNSRIDKDKEYLPKEFVFKGYRVKCLSSWVFSNI